MRGRRSGGWHAWLAAVALMAAVASAQSLAPVAPTIPTDHYGPPSCPGVQADAARETAEDARAEQEKGAESSHSLLAAEPLENFGVARYRLADYADCVGHEGCYWADLDAQYKRAEEALKAQVARHRGEGKLAVVMDIDETTLSGYCEMKREDFGYVGPMFNAWVVSPEAAVTIPGALRFFKAARAAHVAVFFITGRSGVAEKEAAPLGTHPGEDQTAATARNLEAAGFHGWAGLRLRNGEENGMRTIAYKSFERRRIEEKGYTILLSVGDQWSDLLGEPQAEVNVKLPNPFYFLP